MSVSRKPTYTECGEIAEITLKSKLNKGKGYSKKYCYQVLVTGERNNQSIEQVAHDYLVAKDRSLRTAVNRTAKQFKNLNQPV